MKLKGEKLTKMASATNNIIRDLNGLNCVHDKDEFANRLRELNLKLEERIAEK
jgi:benzoyl-CoA reductase/2-hydroxyglutaryl-CoA dehydratase subunit BcrC/BadD/HgdB